MKKLSINFSIAAIVLTATSLASAGEIATRTGDVRVTGDLDELPGGGNAGDENGGFTSLLVGVNSPGRVQNWALLGFDFSGADPAAVATGGRLVMAVEQGFSNGNHGTSADSFVIRELFPTNTGWTEGGQTIQNNATNVANPGVVTFQEQAAATSPWLDAGGSAVDNFIGAFDGTVQVNTGTVSGYENAAGPPILTFVFDAATGQRWLDQGFADLVVEVIDADAMDPALANTTRFNLNNGSAQLIVSTTDDVPGDFNIDGVVDCDDIAQYIFPFQELPGAIRPRLGLAPSGALPNMDLVADGVLDLADVEFLITNLVVTTNGQTGTFLGDLNCDGAVNVLGDAFTLVGSLGDEEIGFDYALGDINLDGVVDVLGDAFALIGNLGMTNEP